MNDYGRARVNGRPRWLRLDGGEALLLAAAPWDAPGGDEVQGTVDPASLDWLAPVCPSKIACFGRNYAAHAAEMGAAPPEKPLLFLKAPSSLLAPGRDVLLPPESERVECEGELALVIGKRVRRFPKTGDPAEVVLGYLTADDVTARDLQRADGQWSRGKGFDTFCPLSPTFTTRPPEPSARILTQVNGETTQEARLDGMSFPLPELLAWASSFMTLEPGDLILTGTPEGVRRLAPGDLVTVSVDGLPELSHGVGLEPA